MQPAATEAISKVKAAGGAVSINIGTLDALWRLGFLKRSFNVYLCRANKW